MSCSGDCLCWELLIWNRTHSATECIIVGLKLTELGMCVHNAL